MYAELEKRVLGSSQIAGIALRYGFFYGPRTWYWTDGAVAEQVKRQEAPIISNGKGVWSMSRTQLLRQSLRSMRSLASTTWLTTILSVLRGGSPRSLAGSEAPNLPK
jgi:hypothetical protein